MKFSIHTALAALCAISKVVASPIAAPEISQWGRDLAERSVPSGLITRVTPNTAGGVTEREATTDLEVRNEDTTISNLSRRQLQESRFKLHVVTNSGRVIGIIIIDYIINSLQSGLHDSIEASFDKLTNVKTDGPVVATHFDNANLPFLSPQNAVFHFATKMVEGTIDLALDRAGVVTSLASATGVKLVGNYVASKLIIFNANNVKIAELRL